VLAAGLGNPPAVRVGPAKRVALVAERSKNPTHSFLAGQSHTDTCRPEAFEGFGFTRRVHYQVLVFWFFYIWSQKDMLLLCAKYGPWYLISFICFIGYLSNQNMERHAPCYILKVSVYDCSSYIISKISDPERPN
jgi:hypothetical protein